MEPAEQLRTFSKGMVENLESKMLDKLEMLEKQFDQKIDDLVAKHLVLKDFIGEGEKEPTLIQYATKKITQMNKTVFQNEERAKNFRDETRKVAYDNKGIFADLAKTNVENDKKITDLQKNLKYTIENVSTAVKDQQRIEKETNSKM